jgi:hypothetical protein
VTRYRRPLLAALTLVAAALVAACGPLGGTQQPAANPTPWGETPLPRTTTTTATSSPTPTGSTSSAVQFTTGGAGPYQIGKTVTQLQAVGLTDLGPDEGCPNNTSARGASPYQDVYLYFKPDGKLYLLRNRSLSVPTPSGVFLGTTHDQLKTIYAGLVTTELSHNGTNAFLVQTLDGSGILFELNELNQVTSMYTAAQATYLRTSFNAGGPYC